MTGGIIQIGETGASVSTIKQDTASNITIFENTNASTPNGIRIDHSAASPDNNSQGFILCEDSTTSRLVVYSDGDVVNHDNSYGAISDIKLKDEGSISHVIVTGKQPACLLLGPRRV